LDAVSNAELVVLGNFLDMQAPVSGGLPMCQAHGFLTAVISAPGEFLPEQWLPVLLGGEPKFESEEHAGQILSIVMRWFHQNDHKKWLMEFEIEGYPDPAIIKEWCLGYLEGVNLYPDWAFEYYDSDEFLPFEVLAGIEGAAQPFEEQGVAVTVEMINQRCMNLLPKYVSTVCVFSQMLAKKAKSRSDDYETVVFEPKIGRNQICPCGSKKKYKRCCEVA
jgi:uncharacterized protein